MEVVSEDFPVCILHTRSGCIPHLTNETASYLSRDLLKDCTYNVPTPTVIDFQDIFTEFDSTDAELFCLPQGSKTYCSVQDPGNPTEKGYNTNKTVAIWVSGGRMNLTPETYMRFVEVMKPNVFELLVDSDVLPSDTKKRNAKSAERSLYCIDKCLEYFKQSTTLQQHSKIMCGIVAGSNVMERTRYCKLAAQKLTQYDQYVLGYVIHSLPTDQDVKQDIRDLISIIRSEMNKVNKLSKPFYVPGVCHPLTVVDYLQCGISMFDTSYITNLSEQTSALVYSYPGSTSTYTQHIGGDNTKEGFVESVMLSDEGFARCYKPIMEGCTCYTCMNHTCAYIHHLSVVNEMLCPVLLMIHNLHHFLSYFKQVRQHYGNSTKLQEFRNNLLQLNQRITDVIPSA